MMRSLYSGVAGLRTHQIKMDVIGNNIANVNTTAYKSQSITFNELMYQTTKKASGASDTSGGTNANQIGLGVKVGAINTNISGQGATQTTNYAFDLAITGNSFFVVNNGVDNLFTRAGSFTTDGKGNLVMSSTGYNVMGWQVDPNTGKIKADTVSPLAIMTETNQTYKAEGTSLATVSGVIDKLDPKVNAASGKIMNLQFYDNNGYKYTAKLSVHKNAGVDNQYYVQLDDILDADGKSIGKAGTDFKFGATSTVGANTSYGFTSASSGKIVANGANSEIQYTDGNGAAQTINLGPTANLPRTFTKGDPEFDANKLSEVYGIDADTYAKMSEFTVDSNGQLTITKKTVDNAVFLNYNANDGTFVNATSGGVTSTEGLASLSFGLPGFSDITVNFSPTSTGNVSKASTISVSPGGTGEQAGMGAGRKTGEMSGFIIQDNGMIYATYDNGQKRLLGQIATASFANPAGLEKRGDNLYAASMNSGDFNGIGEDIKENGGYMTSGQLEMSNVDLSSEFTEMITTQRGFQANSRIITVSDTLLEELTNLKR